MATLKKRHFNLDFLHSNQNNVKISGEILRNEQKRMKLLGTINSSGSDVISLANSFGININLDNKDKLSFYELSSKFELARNIFKFTDIDAKIDDFITTGGININNNPGNKLSNIDLKFDRINFDDYLLIDYDQNKKHLFDYAFGLLSQDSDNRSLFQKFLWLRNIHSDIKYNIIVDNFISNSYEDHNLILKGSINHRHFAIDNLGIQSDKNSFSSNLSIDITASNPSVNFNLDASLLNANFLGYIDSTPEWSTAYFRLPDFSNLPTTINFNLEQFRYKGLELSNLKMNANILDGVLYFDKFNGNIFDKGEFNITGNYIITGVPTMSLAFTVSNLKLGKLAEFMFGKSDIEAYANLTGTINSFGQSIDMFMNRARSDIRIVTQPVTRTDYNIKNLVQYIADLSNFEEDLPEYNMQSLLQGGQVTFSPVNINLKIRKGLFKIDNLTLASNSVKSVYSGLINVADQELILHNVNIFRSYYRSGEDVKEQMLRFDNKYSGELYNPTSELDDYQVKNFVLNIKKSC